MHGNDNISDKITALGLSGIVFVSNVSQRHIDFAVEEKIPCVLVNNYSNKLPSILSDNHKGAYLAGKYLIDHGHKNVAILSGVRSYLSNQERLEGFIQAFQEAGIEVKSELILETGSWLYEAAEKLCFDFSANMPDRFLPLYLLLMIVWLPELLTQFVKPVCLSPMMSASLDMIT